MDHPTEPPVLPNGRGQNAVLLKVGAIGVLLLLLQVPLFLTHGLVRERKQYQAQATNEVSATWGREQAIIGPVLAVRVLPPFLFVSAWFVHPSVRR